MAEIIIINYYNFEITNRHFIYSINEYQMINISNIYAHI